MTACLPLFVYGTLKSGFPNAALCTGRHRPGRFRTLEAMPLWLVGPARLPWLLDQPGDGHRVIGELVEVDRDLLALLDDFEAVGHANGYHRRQIGVQSMTDRNGEAMSAWAYLQHPGHLRDELWRLGPLVEYQPAHARGYRPELE